jgi:hypothetical protein
MLPIDLRNVASQRTFGVRANFAECVCLGSGAGNGRDNHNFPSRKFYQEFGGGTVAGRRPSAKRARRRPDGDR